MQNKSKSSRKNIFEIDVGAVEQFNEKLRAHKKKQLHRQNPKSSEA